MKSRAGLLVAIAHGEVSQDFEAYKVKFDKHYASAADEAYASRCWEEAVGRINESKMTNHTVFGENVFSDLCHEDFVRARLLPEDSNGACTFSPPPPDYTKPYDLSKTIDWRSQGRVAHIKDQGSCGSCWAHAAVAVMEGQWAKEKGQVVPLSEQELVSCYKGNCGGDGADGGLAWVISHGGINSFDNYPYVSGSGSVPKCDAAKAAVNVATFMSAYYIRNDEKKFLAAVQNEGPLAVGVQAAPWHDYSGGIVTRSQCGGLGTDHAVTAVGYGKSGGQAYYVIKNSWGAEWGESGYIRLTFGENTCNIANCYANMIRFDGPPPPEPCHAKSCLFARSSDDCTDHGGFSGCSSSGAGFHLTCKDGYSCDGGMWRALV